MSVTLAFPHDSRPADLEEKTIAMTTEQDTEGGNKQLGVTVRMDRAGTCVAYLHAPYWIVNKTGLPLQLRVSAPSETTPQRQSGFSVHLRFVLESSSSKLRRAWFRAGLPVRRGLRPDGRGGSALQLPKAAAALRAPARLPLVLVVRLLSRHRRRQRARGLQVCITAGSSKII